MNHFTSLLQRKTCVDRPVIISRNIPSKSLSVANAYCTVQTWKRTKALTMGLHDESRAT